MISGNVGLVGVSERVYRVTSTELGAENWQSIYSNLPGIGGPFEVQDTNGFQRLHYRLGVELP